MKILWGAVADPGAAHGYGVITGMLYMALQKAGAEFVETTDSDWDCVVVPALPIAWPFGKNGTRRDDFVWHTMFDMERIPRAWPGILNRCGVVWVPSQWCADNFLAAGVTAPIEISGYGIDNEVFAPPPVKTPARDGKYRVLAMGDYLVGRKNILKTVTTFMQARLPDDAVLELKLNAGASGPYMVDGNTHEPLPNIVVHSADWTRGQLAAWLRTGDLFIYLSGGEGFGLQPLEAMACGLPVICADHSGMREYLSPSNALLVPTMGFETSVTYSVRFHEDFEQYKPNYGVAADLIAWCYKNPNLAAAVGKQAAKDAARWTWEAAGTRALSILMKHYG